ncbi:MAG: hypothetical protein Q9218_002391 [Villophora microphyllina]
MSGSRGGAGSERQQIRQQMRYGEIHSIHYTQDNMPNSKGAAVSTSKQNNSPEGAAVILPPLLSPTLLASIDEELARLEEENQLPPAPAVTGQRISSEKAHDSRSQQNNQGERHFVHFTVIATNLLSLRATFYSFIDGNYQKFKATITRELFLQNSDWKLLEDAKIENMFVIGPNGNTVRRVTEECFDNFAAWFYRQARMGKPGVLHVQLLCSV